VQKSTSGSNKKKSFQTGSFNYVAVFKYATSTYALLQQCFWEGVLSGKTVYEHIEAYAPKRQKQQNHHHRFHKIKLISSSFFRHYSFQRLFHINMFLFSIISINKYMPKFAGGEKKICLTSDSV
jgi:hypothetical protein